MPAVLDDRRAAVIRVVIAEAAVAGDHVRHAFLDAAEFAIRHHVAGAEILHRAPWRIAEAAGVGGRSAHRRCPQAGDRQYAWCFHHLSV